MNVRTTLLAASVALLAFAGCGSDRSTTPPGNDAGCTTNCGGADSGTPDSGTPDSGTPDSGTPDSGTPDAGPPPTSIATLRGVMLADGGFQDTAYKTHVLVKGTVQAIDYVSADGGTEQFWVVDDSGAGIYVHRYSGGGLGPVVGIGDQVSVDGYFMGEPAYSKYGDTNMYRYEITDLYKGLPDGGSIPTVFTVTGTGAAPADAVDDAGTWSDAQEGMHKFYQDSELHAGTRVHINGPLTLVNASPTALARITFETDGGVTTTPVNGFELDNGILVVDSKTYSKDGGFGAPDRCDWASLAQGGNTVTFPNGVSGVWDTYSMSPCTVQSDGGCYYGNGYVPNPNSNLPDGGLKFSYALYPQNCADLPGDAGAGVTP